MLSLHKRVAMRLGAAICVLSFAATFTPAQQPVLTQSPFLLDGAQPSVSETSANADARLLGSATSLDGGVLLHAPESQAWRASVYEPVWGGRELDGIDLARGTYSPFELDLALPTRGPAWTVARSLAPSSRWNPQLSAWESNVDTAGGLTGSMGARWMASGQPTVARAGSDVIVVFLGADRHITFARSAGATTYRGVNGAAGVITDATNAGIP